MSYYYYRVSWAIWLSQRKFTICQIIDKLRCRKSHHSRRCNTKKDKVKVSYLPKTVLTNQLDITHSSCPYWWKDLFQNLVPHGYPFLSSPSHASEIAPTLQGEHSTRPLKAPFAIWHHHPVTRFLKSHHSPLLTRRTANVLPFQRCSHLVTQS